MNRLQLEELLRAFEDDDSDPGSKADARLLALHMRKLITAILDDPPADTLDTSLRGLVMSENEGNRVVWWATEKGLRSDTDERYGVCLSWDEVKLGDCTVRALTPEDIGYRVRKWDEWTPVERDEWMGGAPAYDWRQGVNLAIDIATRGEA